MIFTGPRRRTDENVVPSTAVPLSDARMLEEETQRFGQHHDQPQLYIDRRGIFNLSIITKKKKKNTKQKLTVVTMLRMTIYTYYIYVCIIFDLI